MGDRGGKGVRGGAGQRGTTWRIFCKIAMKLPGVEQGTSYGTPALHVRKRFLARLKEDGESVALKVDFLDREVLLELDPAAFYLTDHYRPYPAVLVRLKQVRPAMMKQLLEQSWRFVAQRGRDEVGEAPRARRRSARPRSRGRR